MDVSQVKSLVPLLASPPVKLKPLPPLFPAATKAEVEEPPHQVGPAVRFDKSTQAKPVDDDEEVEVLVANHK